MSKSKKLNCRTEVQNVQGSSNFPKYSSNAVLFQGPSNECMGVCTNSTLTSVINVILEDLCEVNSFLNVENYDVCEAIKKELKSEYNIKDLMQILLSRSCSIEDMKSDIENVLGDTKRIVLNLKCLKDRVDNDNCGEYTPLVLRTILQLLIDAHCELYSEFNMFKTDITTYIKSEIDSALSNISDYDPIPIGTILAYKGPLNLFDASGKGTGVMSKYAIANGANGTQDYRGFVLVGTQANVGTMGLDALVSSTNYAMNDKGGVLSHILNNNMSHNHGITGTISINNLNLTVVDDTATPAMGGGTEAFVVSNAKTASIRTKSITMPSVNNNLSTIATGLSSQTLNNRMPYKAVVFIEKIA